VVFLVTVYIVLALYKSKAIKYNGIRGDYMKKILVLVFVGFMSMMILGCSDKALTTWDEIEERGYFIVGLDDTFAPMGFRDESGELVGFDIDLAKAVSEVLGVEVQFQPIDWDSKVLELNSGKIDMIWNGLTITEEREKEMLFSNPYIENAQIIMVLENSNIDSISDLEGLTLGVQISSAAEEAVLKNSVSTLLDELVKYDTYNTALLELNNGQVDAIVIDEIMGRYIMSQNPGEYIVASENFGEEAYGIGFRLNSEDIRDKINEALVQLVEDGIAKTISEKWFDEDIFVQ